MRFQTTMLKPKDAVYALLLAAAPLPLFAADAGIDWIRIPGGSFDMGSPPGDRTDPQTGRTWKSELTDNERPVHRVAVKPFEMAKSPVTFKQYRACVAAGACTPSGCEDQRFMGDDQPVVCVDWFQARAFSVWAGGRLPSEAEWEYAARSAGKSRDYPWGDELPTCERASMSEHDLPNCGLDLTSPVCSKPKGNTDQGLCDMAGLVWQWTQDWYHDSYEGAPRDGSAWETPAGFARVARGGSYDNKYMLLRAANRGYGDPNFRCTSEGGAFRNFRAIFLYFRLVAEQRTERSLGFRPVRTPTSSR